MGRRKIRDKKRIKNLGKHAVKKPKLLNEISNIMAGDCFFGNRDDEEAYQDIMCGDSSRSNSPAPSISSNSSSSSFIISPDDLGVDEAASLQKFSSILQEGMKRFMQNLKNQTRPSRYNKMGNPAPRTKRRHQKNKRDQIKAYRDGGYHDISTFFKRTTSITPSPLTPEETNFQREPEWIDIEEDMENNEDVMSLYGEGEEEEEEVMVAEEEEEEEEEEFAALTKVFPREIDPILPVSITECNNEFMGRCCAIHEKEYLENSSAVINPGRQKHAHPPARNLPRLQSAVKELTKRSKNQHLSYIFRSRILAMLVLLRFYTGTGRGWHESSILAAEASGKGQAFARSLRTWVWEYLKDDTNLPESLYGTCANSIIHNEDFSQELQLHLQSLDKRCLKAVDIIRYLNQDSIKERWNIKKIPSERTVQNWMHAMNFRYAQPKNGMYIDGHEREDVVHYRQNLFLPFWFQIENQMAKWTNDNECVMPHFQFPGQRRIVLITHDESTFYANDRRKTRWVHAKEKPEPVRKGEGVSIMVSDFCSPDLGWLCSRDGMREARIFFRAGKNRDGYFDADDLMAQTDLAMQLFEDNFPHGSAIAAFGFDNAPGHLKRAKDALSAHYMPKFPKAWINKKGINCKMRPGWFPNGQQQNLYFPDDHPTHPGWFKGMKLILEERGIDVGGKNAECREFKCPDTSLTSVCCCRRILFNQPDFISQKPALIELIESHGHIAFFYPKFHCELNFIEQCWGAAKCYYRKLPLTKNQDEMEANIKKSLNTVDIVKMRRFSNRANRFMDAYRNGLAGSEAVWASKKYHGHRVLPANFRQELENDIEKI